MDRPYGDQDFRESPPIVGKRIIMNKSFESSINIFDETKRESLPLKILVQGAKERIDTFNSSLRDRDDSDLPRKTIVKRPSNHENNRSYNSSPILNSSSSSPSPIIRSAPLSPQMKKPPTSELPIYSVDLSNKKIEMLYPSPPKKIHKVSRRLYNPPNSSHTNNSSIMFDKETNRNVFDASTLLEDDLDLQSNPMKPKKGTTQTPTSRKTIYQYI